MSRSDKKPRPALMQPLDLDLNLSKDALQFWIRRLFTENVKRADERDAGIDHGGELAAEDRKVLQLHPAPSATGY